LNSFKLGVVDPQTNLVTQDVPASVPQLSGLIPATDPNQPTAVEIEVLPKGGRLVVTFITTPGFFAPDILVKSLSFGPGMAPAKAKRHALRDTDGDGDLDLRVRVKLKDTSLPCGDTTVFVSGTTISGDIIMGSAAITTTCDKSTKSTKSTKERSKKW
jgi:hypothetical protein